MSVLPARGDGLHARRLAGDVSGVSLERIVLRYFGVNMAGTLNLRILISRGCRGVLLVCTVFVVVVVVVRITGKMRVGGVQDVRSRPELVLPAHPT